ncbi:hypothetical protein GBAR_LOCUS4891 [Geodia barretti]|uniref:Uncharacterized protein n=1 Tax=Geodia barretti TaxID=519541 RepID=A0AA35R8H3_GEOBA|nr:hypothetical protein GBAR_LOCUS4891 [Geodia barretti]
MLQFSRDFFESREPQRVSLRHDRNPAIVGVYRCDVSTISIHDNIDTSVRDVLYVGLYTPDQGTKFHCWEVWHLILAYYLRSPVSPLVDLLQLLPGPETHRRN